MDLNIACPRCKNSLDIKNVLLRDLLESKEEQPYDKDRVSGAYYQPFYSDNSNIL